MIAVARWPPSNFVSTLPSSLMSQMKSVGKEPPLVAVSDKAKTVTTVVQAFLWSAFALFIIAFVFSSAARNHVAKMAKEANVKSIGEKGIEFGTLEEKTLQLVQENAQLRQKQNPVPVNQDVRPDPAAAAVLTALQQVNPQTTREEGFWVYVGEYNEQKHAFRNSPNFELNAPPKGGATITATSDVYKRDRQPYKDANGNWLLGRIVGVVPKGKSVNVLETAKIEGENQYDFNSWVRAKDSD